MRSLAAFIFSSLEICCHCQRIFLVQTKSRTFSVNSIQLISSIQGSFLVNTSAVGLKEQRKFPLLQLILLSRQCVRTGLPARNSIGTPVYLRQSVININRLKAGTIDLSSLPQRSHCFYFFDHFDRFVGSIDLQNITPVFVQHPGAGSVGVEIQILGLPLSPDAAIQKCKPRFQVPKAPERPFQFSNLYDHGVKLLR